jgi:Ni,Fe-hydrogenase III small subunit/formate hydrogenlyase subunit 6/NADH:ubiquinone oxidoreductase subunit I
VFKNIIQGLRKGVVTTRYPEEQAHPPERFRGMPEFQVGCLFVNLPPVSVCPTAAMTANESYGEYTIDLTRCIFCGHCAANSQGTIRMNREFELSARLRKNLLVQCIRDNQGRIAEATPLPADTSATVDRIASRIHRTLGDSLHLRHLDAGSCNACDWELTALLGPHYDLRRLCIDFVASPRHADGVIVTGCVTRNLELAARRTFEAVPDPRVVIALGACACSGGIAGASYASAGGVDSLLPVDVYIPGCPPRPEAILFGVLMVIGRMEQKRHKLPAQPAGE